MHSDSAAATGWQLRRAISIAGVKNDFGFDGRNRGDRRDGAYRAARLLHGQTGGPRSRKRREPFGFKVLILPDGESPTSSGLSSLACNMCGSGGARSPIAPLRVKR